MVTTGRVCRGLMLTSRLSTFSMIGHPKHVAKAIDAGADIICAQGGEGGGHTGNVPTSILIPTVVALCRGHKSALTGEDVAVVAAAAASVVPSSQ